MSAIRISSDHETKGAFLFMDFFKLLVSLTNDNNLEYTDIHVMSVLVTYAQYAEDKTIEISANDIHDVFKRIPIRTIRRCLQRLEELHYIEAIKQKPPKKNKYRVLIQIPGQTAAPDKPKIQQKKNKYAAASDVGTPISEYQRIAAKNPFLN